VLRDAWAWCVNKEDAVFRALIAGKEGDPYSVIEKMFADLERTRAAWCNESDIYELSGERLLKAMSALSVFDKYDQESEERYKERNRALYTRYGDTLWGDKWNIERLFKGYMKNDFVYVVNDAYPISETRLENGYFDDLDAGWELSGGARCIKEARLAGWYGVALSGAGSVAQEAALSGAAGQVYVLHFFCAGKVRARVTSFDGARALLWEAPEKIDESVGRWTEDSGGASCTRGAENEWRPARVFFTLPEKDARVRFEFASGEPGKTAAFDYARVFKKEAGESSWALISVFSTVAHEKALTLAPDGAGGAGGAGGAPLTIDYSRMSYIEDAHVLGAEQEHKKHLFSELLEVVKPAGIECVFEYLTRESDPRV
jgi:hypothetical protein